MLDIIVQIALLLAWVVFMALNLASANRERNRLEMLRKGNEPRTISRKKQT